MSSSVSTGMGQKIIDEIKITTNPTTEIKQALANPLLEQRLNLQERDLPDLVIEKSYFNRQTSLTSILDNEFQFLLLSPHPIDLKSIYLEVKIKLDGLPPRTAETHALTYQIMPVNNFGASLFRAIKIQAGQNTQEIDHIDQYNAEWSQLIERLETTDQFAKAMGVITGHIPDTPYQYQFTAAGTIPATNVGGRLRANNLLAGQGNNPATSAVIECWFQPSHMLFQKNKFWPPYVPLRLQCTKAPVASYIKAGGTTAAPTVTWLDCTICFQTYQLDQSAYADFEKMFIRNLETDEIPEVPINPYRNPLAIYSYFDVRASAFTIPANVQTFTQQIRWATILPKGILLTITRYDRDDLRVNHFDYRAGNNLQDYQTLVNSQPKVPLMVRRSDGQATYGQFYLRLRNFLDQHFSSATTNLYYNDYEGGAMIIAELLNPQNSLNITSKVDVGNLELVLNFATAVNYVMYANVYLIYDQTFILDEMGNGHLVKAV